MATPNELDQINSNVAFIGHHARVNSIFPDSESIQRALNNDAISVAQIFVRRGMEFEKQGNFLRAVDDYDTALRVSPDDENVLLRRGIAFAGNGDLGRAIANFDDALRIKPEFPEALLARANIWRRKRQFDRALSDYDAAMRLGHVGSDVPLA